MSSDNYENCSDAELMNLVSTEDNELAFAVLFLRWIPLLRFYFSNRLNECFLHQIFCNIIVFYN